MFVSAINKFLIGETKGSAGAVCGDDGGIWSCSSTFALNRNEVFQARKVFIRINGKSTEELSNLQFTLSGVKFYVTSYNFNCYYPEIQAKAVDYESGCSLILMNSGFVIGYYDSPVTPEENLISTRKLVTHVSELGY
ncbi:Profilin [Entamoeba marina]